MTRIDVETSGQTNDHAGLMDGMYRYQRHIYDLTRKYYLLGRDGTIRTLDVPENGTLLEVACGTGRNLLLAREAYPKARLYGFDISQEMLLSAEKAFNGDGVKPLFKVADATTFEAQDFGTEGFDRIMISYALSMIPEWEKAVGAALAALNPGGSLHIVDFGQQERLPGWFGTLLKTWLAKFHVTPRADMRQVLERQAAAIGARLEFETIGGGYAWRARIFIKR